MLAVLLFVANSFVCQAQAFFNLSSKAEKQKIHFTLYRNIIVIPVYLNGQGPFNFILDSGAGSCLITDAALVNQLQLLKGRAITIKGSGEQSDVSAFLVHYIQVSGEAFTSIPLTMAAFEEDPFLLSEYLGCTIHGILGYEFFNSFKIRINYQSHTLTLMDPAMRIRVKNFDTIPVFFRNKRPYISGSCAYNKDSVIQLPDILIDTGAGFPASLETYASPFIHIPEKSLASELGVGLNGVIEGNIGRIPQFGFGNFVFQNIVTAFPDYSSTGSKQLDEMRNGSIGNFLLNRFTVIFDYANETLYLKPNAAYRKHFPYDRTGIEVIATGEEYVQFIVKTVKPDSPAEEIGILPGDEIVEINFQKITTYELSKIDHLLSNPAANTITLRIKRGAETIFMLVEMRDLI